MRCEELEAIVFSGREISAEERAEMEAHAKTCEACRALMDNADALRGMQRIDEDVTPPESFKTGWRSAIRQTPRVISIGDWMRRKGARVVGYAACAALVFAAARASDGWAETKKTRRGRLRLRLRRLRYLRSLSAGGRGRALREQCSGAWRAQRGGKGRGERQHGGGREEDRPQRMADPENRAL